jgi:CotS family spore coat protein
MTGEERLPDFLQHHYGITLKTGKPIGGVLKIETNEGTFILKRVRQGEKNRWRMIQELSEYVSKGRVEQVGIASLHATRSKQPFFNGYRFSYVLLPWIEASPVRLEHPEDWKKTTQALAHFHRGTRGFVPKESYRKLQQAGKWMFQWQQAQKQLEIFSLAARWTTSPTEVDRTWLDTAAYTMGLMENVIAYYEKINGDERCKDTMQHGKICHHNLHRQNLLTNQRGKTYLLDWNEAVFDVRSNDLAQWLCYAYGRTGSGAVLKAILDGYQEVSPLEEPEYSLMYVRFLWPSQLLPLLNRVYQVESVSTAVASSQMANAAQIEEKKIQLLKLYPSMIKENFHVSIPTLDWIK